MSDIYKMSEDPVLQQLLKEEKREQMLAKKSCNKNGHQWGRRMRGYLCNRCSKWRNTNVLPQD